MALDPSAITQGTAPAVASSRIPAPAAAQPRVETKANAEVSAATRATPPTPDISHQLEKLTRVLQESQSSLSFSVDDSTGKTVVRVVRSSTGELVRQIPSEEALAIAASIETGEPVGTLGLDRWS